MDKGKKLSLTTLIRAQLLYQATLKKKEKDNRK